MPFAAFINHTERYICMCEFFAGAEGRLHSTGTNFVQSSRLQSVIPGRAPTALPRNLLEKHILEFYLRCK